MCAGCAMTLFIRLAIAFPNPLKIPSLSGTALPDAWRVRGPLSPFVYGNYGDKTAWQAVCLAACSSVSVTNQKDVVVMAGDGGTALVQQLLPPGSVRSGFTTIMLDNEVYGNTGGQGKRHDKSLVAVLKMAPLGRSLKRWICCGWPRLRGVHTLPP